MGKFHGDHKPLKCQRKEHPCSLPVPLDGSVALQVITHTLYFGFKQPVVRRIHFTLAAFPQPNTHTLSKLIPQRGFPRSQALFGSGQFSFPLLAYKTL